jgi:hypothetical protein
MKKFNEMRKLKQGKRGILTPFLIAVLCSIFFILHPCIGQKKQPNNTKYLLLDNRVIKQVENAKLTVGVVKKHPSNPLFVEDKPWEKRFDNLYGNVLYDEEDELYKCWYSPFIIDNSAKGMSLKERENDYDAPDTREMAICYATSKDGIHWEKPNLGLVDFEGNKNNNIVWQGKGQDGDHWAGPHGAGIFKDMDEKDPNRRYKALFKIEDLSIGFSKDGLHWDEYQACEGDVTVAGDTHNNALWAPTLNKYVGITRTWGKMGREVARIESNDFIHWTKEEVVLEGLDKNLQPYAMPVFYYGGVYLGLVAIHNQKTDRVHTELTWSPDTKKWNRISPGTPLIPCSDKKLDYDYGCVYACAYPVFKDNEIQLFYGGSDWLHFGWRSGALALATLRPDGFAGYEVADNASTGVVTTHSFTVTGSDLKISADIMEGGSLQVAILNEQGVVIPEYTFEACNTLPHNSVDALVTWKENSFSELKGKKVAFRFLLDNSKVYSVSGDLQFMEF